MKALLVIDMPTACCRCKLFTFATPDDFDSTDTYCKVCGFRNDDGIHTRPDWCPLRPIDLDAIEDENPYKIVGRSETYNQYNEGWCDAINRIRGELYL